MKEKKFIRWMAVWSLLILGIYLAAALLMKVTLSNELRERIPNISRLLSEAHIDKVKIEDFDIHMSEPNLIDIKRIEQINHKVYITFVPVKKGSGEVYMTVTYKGMESEADNFWLKAEKSGLLIDKNSMNFSSYREKQLAVTILICAFALLLWIGYFRSQKKLGFSYQSIYCVGLGIWASIISVCMLYDYMAYDEMINLYSTLTSAPTLFAIITFPLVVVFAIFLTISNVSLIRHERFRFANILGILLSASMVLGFLILLIVFDQFNSGREMMMRIIDSIQNILFAVYAILECFLIGAIICGRKAAGNRPAYDKDYIVILGCLIKKDGTLFPLIRGRVDRAIRFYKEQLEATGKKAVFLPSGGQGKNEVISEAEAMKRYLLKQGFGEEDILMEDQSKNTRQNMEFSKKLIGREDAKVVFSTTNYHVFRSGIISRQVGFEADGMGTPTKWYFWPNAYVREVIGMISYKWKSLFLIFLPITAFILVVQFGF